MKILGLTVGILFLLVGCKTYETTTITIYRPDGTVDKVVTKSVEASPFYCKSVSASADVYGIQASFIDPESGSWSPNVKILVGDTDASTLPVTSGREGIVETFGTFRESLTYEKSLWGAELARFGYERTAGGCGVNAVPAVKATIDLNRNAATATDKNSSEVK
jgi:hypothetical protein